MTFRPDTSFPFLKIAHDHGLPYGDVIRRAQWMDRPALLGETFGTSKLDVDIAWALVAERRRRATIIHNAIHTGDAP